ncbi:MAG TPA: tRNA (adenosine(37)-N6)-dimethylallyltransferase MiaA [Rhizomicrobium sp.]|nr:tRNA (adenosine(37)-N6)-dimethylallyltransferase MiaA [Rhizomicrobium sp.]
MTVDAVLIAGPTASGKSQAALALARAVGGVVINADSMQIYREAPILTAMPSDVDRAAAPHLLYGHASVKEPYSTGRYREDAQHALAEVRASSRVPIFAGGTGLYFSALTEGIADIPQIPSEIRTRVRAHLEKIGVAALHAQLARRDSETAARLRPSDPQRVLRAFEVFEATGKPLAHWQGAGGKAILGGLRLARFVIDVPRPELRARIEERFKAMFFNGALREAAALKGLDPALPAAKILGLRELWAVQEGKLSEAEAIERAVTVTRQYAKRQSTWFRNRMADWDRLDSNGAADIISRVAV